MAELSERQQVGSAATESIEPRSCSARYREPRWYVLYTHSHHEKCVAERVRDHEMESFLPLYRSIRFWKDRRKELDLPLFPGYVFVRTSLKERVQLLQLPGVVQFVTFNGQPAPVTANEIEMLRKTLAADAYAEPYPYLKVGRRVRVRSGPLTGVEGILVYKKNRLRVALSIDLIQRSVAVEVDAQDIEPVH